MRVCTAASGEDRRTSPPPRSTCDGVAYEPGPIEVLERWQHFGATRRVVLQTEESITVSLCRCDGCFP